MSRSRTGFILEKNLVCARWDEDNTTFDPGEEVEWVIRVRNTGTHPTPVTITDNFSALFSQVDWELKEYPAGEPRSATVVTSGSGDIAEPILAIPKMEYIFCVVATIDPDLDLEKRSLSVCNFVRLDFDDTCDYMETISQEMIIIGPIGNLQIDPRERRGLDADNFMRCMITNCTDGEQCQLVDWLNAGGSLKDLIVAAAESDGPVDPATLTKAKLAAIIQGG